jgi:hypothetical protein
MRDRSPLWLLSLVVVALVAWAAGCGGGADDAEEADVTTTAATPSAGGDAERGQDGDSRAGGFSRIIFLHHSVGAGLIEQGGVRERLTELGYQFYDHGYNDDGLVLADGTWTGDNFDVPDDNTDPDGFARIFAQPLHDPPDNTFSHLMQYDVIAFKSCFPVSNIESDDQLAEYESYYLSVRDRMDEYPDKIFIVVTQPPEIPNDTDPEAAARARSFAGWLASDEYLSGHSNVFTFNFFDLLADSDDTLRAEYRTDESDAHPNETANQTIGPFFADFVDRTIKTYSESRPETQRESQETPSSATATPRPSTPGDTGTSSGLIQPSDLEYLGAFRLPGAEDGMGWEYGGAAMTYYPDGDPDGPADGYPGSIFATGHDWYQRVSEISIPAPIISPAKNLDDLNTTTTLQDFQDVRADLFGEMEIPRAGLEYLPPQGNQTTGKLYFAWAQHMGEGETNPSHGWSEIDLSNRQTAGPWRIGDYWNYVTGDYIFAIPQTWADANAPGMYLATGRFRDGGQGAQGPSLFVYGPWTEGDPPPPNSTLPATPLLLYSDVTASEQFTLNHYHHSDEWSGAAWLTAGDKAAVVFVGTKGRGDCWYGNPDGPCLDCENRGWWSDSFVGQILFYDPADLAAVARGEMETYLPQPYATLDIDDLLYHVGSEQQKYHLGAASFDRERGLLYVFEPFADGDGPLVHVWRVEA